MFSVKSIIYLDTYEKEYIRVLVLSKIPPGPLANFVVRITNNKLSEFDVKSKFHNNRDDCLYVIKRELTGYNGGYKYLTIDDVDELIDYNITNNYNINTAYTEILQRNKRVNSKDDVLFYLTY